MVVIFTIIEISDSIDHTTVSITESGPIHNTTVDQILQDKINSMHDALLSFYVALMILTITNIVLFASGGYCDCCCGSQVWTIDLH